MGFGSSGAGTTPAGFDAPTTTEERRLTKIAAYKVDGATLDYVRDDAGRLVGEHPIDAKVFHRLRIRARSVRSAPGTGNESGNRFYVNPSTLEAEVRDDVNQALGDMLASGEIADRGIEFDRSVPTRTAYRDHYVNLKTGKRQFVPST
jgi:hypothetical protein